METFCLGLSVIKVLFPDLYFGLPNNETNISFPSLHYGLGIYNHKLSNWIQKVSWIIRPFFMFGPSRQSCLGCRDGTNLCINLISVSWLLMQSVIDLNPLHFLIQWIESVSFILFVRSYDRMTMKISQKDIQNLSQLFSFLYNIHDH